ncbi:CoA-binding protein [Burkholderia thailandensis]|uniref:CoA-binding protein n=1 Tax=Burkholderia thailandensis TaxID=57975 RepID=UPI00298FD8E1|nr:CoA-binding protein [Burkholderia thailandensis]
MKRDRPIAVVGLSDKSYRPSYEVAAYLRQTVIGSYPSIRCSPVHGACCGAASQRRTRAARPSLCYLSHLSEIA